MLSLLTVAASGHPLNSDYQYPVYPMVPNFLFFRSIDVADVSDAFPDVFWVQAPTNGAFGASLPPLVISSVQQSNPPLLPPQKQIQ